MNSKEFWKYKWEKQDLGFNQPEANRHLVKYAPQVFSEKGASVFVPLCGKTVDMLWLANYGFKIVGVEYISKAINDFFSENAITFKLKKAHHLHVHSWGKHIIYGGDFFHLQAAHLQDVTYVYDRAALVALDREDRKRYVAHLQSSLPSKHEILLIVYERLNDTHLGPPFHVSQDEVGELFRQKYEIKLLEKVPPKDDQLLQSCIYHLVHKL